MSLEIDRAPNRSPAISYQELLDSDSRPAPAVLRLESPRRMAPWEVPVERYTSAAWHEREAWELFGIHFTGHQKLRRLLLADWTDTYLCLLGQGSRQRRIQAGVTDATGLLASSIAQDKELTKMMLRSAGIPVPAGRPALDAADAWEAALAVGPPVVVKPRDADLGEGVSLNLTTREQVLAAHAVARQVSSNVLVEKFAPGAHHRLLVIGNRMVAAARRDPAQVVGDGTRTGLPDPSLTM